MYNRRVVNMMTGLFTICLLQPRRIQKSNRNAYNESNL